jgi:hypothetical protein
MNRAKTRQPRPVYRIEQRHGRWMLIAPNGSPFVSLGVVHTGAVPGFRDEARERRTPLTEKIAANLQQWGFNTAGYHHPSELRDRMPFLADTYIAWVPYFAPRPRYPDVFGGYGGAARRAVHQMCAPVKSNPNLIGYYWTDTPRWDLDNARRLVNDDWVSAIRGSQAIYPGKQRYVAFLRERHGANPDAFRKLYGTDLYDPSLLHADFAGLLLDDPVVHRDDYDFLRLIAREYYRAAGEAMEREDRKHLVFGDRYLLTDMPTEVLEEALPWTDAIAVQPCEPRFEKDRFDRVYRISRKPILICDHALSFPTARYPETGWPKCASEADAARAYEEYLKEAFAQPYILGYHRCHYLDRFSKSRGVLMQGLVREDWTPYPVLVEGVRRANCAMLETFQWGNRGE